MKTRKYGLIGMVFIGMVMLTVFYSFQTKDITKSSLSKNVNDTTAIDPAQKERDVFYTMMAYAVVYKDWQTKSAGDSSRGYNIGSVLVNKNNYVVNWAVNSVNVLKNKTQHGEVRLMQGFIEKSKESTLKDYTIYTTLEPCAMCSGMMTLLQIYRTVYGQTDPDYGKALERLQLDSRSCTAIKGYPPYPRPVISNKSYDKYSTSIDSAYAVYQSAGGKGITAFLATNGAKVLFNKASNQFQNYKLQYPTNKPYLDSAKRYFNTITVKIR